MRSPSRSVRSFCSNWAAVRPRASTSPHQREIDGAGGVDAQGMLETVHPVDGDLDQVSASQAIIGLLAIEIAQLVDALVPLLFLGKEMGEEREKEKK